MLHGSIQSSRVHEVFSERHEDHHLHLPTDQGALGSLRVLPCAGLQAPGNGLRPLRENRGIENRSSISNSPRSPETENLRASCFCNGNDHWEYVDESVEIEVEVASAPRALRAGRAPCDARVVDDLRARPRRGAVRQLRGLCAARLTRISGCRPPAPVEGRLGARGGFDDVAAGPSGPAAVRISLFYLLRIQDGHTENTEVARRSTEKAFRE